MFLAALALLILLAACGDSSDDGSAIAAAREACSAAAEYRESSCARQCPRLADAAARADCESTCADDASDTRARCAADIPAETISCRIAGCDDQIDTCRSDAAQAFDACTAACGGSELRCLAACEEARADDEEACGFAAAEIVRAPAATPKLPIGRPADLSVLLDAEELAVVEAADRRAETLRSRPLRLSIGAADTTVRITQVGHDFEFGFPVDFREFDGAPEDLETYGGMASGLTNLMVAETSLKWRNAEPQRDEPRFDLADDELAWANENGFPVKAHVLLWGNAPPVASGSGTPEWLRDLFPETDLSDREADELRELIRKRIDEVVGRYSGRIGVWEVTNEMLNPLTSWFSARLGQDIVDDVFRWSREADPGAELVYNEWISEIFTGLPGPDASAVRDRIVELVDDGVPIDVLGVQGHFAPGLVNVGVEVDLSKRTRIDDYAAALDTLAEAGLPIHITEVTIAAPDEPEARAAQAEAVMRLWWGHESVEQVVFWSLWNKLGPRSHLNLGVYDDEGNLNRHGEAILSLINDRWRTRAEVTTDDSGTAELQVTLGTYVAQWTSESGPVHIRFHVGRGPGRLTVAAVGH